MTRRRHDDITRAQQAVVAFELANQWRVERVAQLGHQLDEHWNCAVVTAARDGHPQAYGTILLSAARTHLTEQISNLLLRSCPPSSRPHHQ